MYNREKIEITSDIYCISSRIKELDRDYKVYFNKKKLRYEVYFKNNLSFVVGKTLDRRAISKALITHIRNKNKIFKDIHENNLKLDKKNNDYILNKSRTRLNSFIEYADKKGGNIDFSSFETTIWI